jgi:hypothetical protein
MRINGQWLLCDDGVVRPVLFSELLTSDGLWRKIPFLLDTGADRTVLNAGALDVLKLPQLPSFQQLGGVGGEAATVRVETQIRMTVEGGENATFRGQFSAFTDPYALDMSVLGRDITDIFAVIVDRPGDTVCQLGQQHGYAIGLKER